MKQNAKELAKIISEISGKEERLLYYPPEEIEEIIREKRAVILKEEGKIAGFGSWSLRGGDWAEIDMLYVAPEFRKRKYLGRILAMIFRRVKHEAKKVVIFTRAPQVKREAGKFGFRSLPTLYRLPVKVLGKLFVHRFHPRRWRPCVMKYGLKLSRLGMICTLIKEL